MHSGTGYNYGSGSRIEILASESFLGIWVSFVLSSQYNAGRTGDSSVWLLIHPWEDIVSAFSKDRLPQGQRVRVCETRENFECFMPKETGNSITTRLGRVWNGCLWTASPSTCQPLVWLGRGMRTSARVAKDISGICVGTALLWWKKGQDRSMAACNDLTMLPVAHDLGDPLIRDLGSVAGIHVPADLALGPRL